MAKKRTWKVVEYISPYHQQHGIAIQPSLDTWNPTRSRLAPSGLILNPDDWHGTIRYRSMGYRSRVEWEIISHPEPQLIGFTFTSNLNLLTKALVPGNSLPEITGNFRWTSASGTLGAEQL